MSGLNGFLRDDMGAVTIDWIALTSGILLLGIMVVYAIFNNGVSALVLNINDTLASVATGVDVGPAPDLNGSGETDESGDTICITVAGTTYCQPL
jgi:hypothetical protein